MSVSVFEHIWLSPLFGDAEIASAFDPNAVWQRMLAFEVGLTVALQQAGFVEDDAAQVTLAKCETFKPDLAALGLATARDGVPVPEFVRQMRAHIGSPHGDLAHFGATSQDVTDTVLVQSLDEANAILDARLGEIIDALERLRVEHGSNLLTSRTHLQAGVPITVADRLASWRDPLLRHRERLAELAPRLSVLQFGGVAGTLDALGEHGAQVAAILAEELGLRAPERSWHATRDSMAEYAAWLSLVTGSLGKLGQDIALMAQTDIETISLSSHDAYCEMPYQQNPVQAELLVTLAGFNATQTSGMHNALVHAQEHSSTAWALEWMLLPQMVMASGCATRTTLALLADVERLGDADQRR